MPEFPSIFFLLTALITALPTADTSYSSSELIHYGTASAKGFSVKHAKCFCSAMKALQKCKAFVVLRADTAVCRQPPENTDSTSVLSTTQSLVGESCFLKPRLKAPGVRTAKNHLGQQYELPWRESSLALGNTACKQIPQMCTVREKHLSGAHPLAGDC